MEMRCWTYLQYRDHGILTSVLEARILSSSALARAAASTGEGDAEADADAAADVAVVAVDEVVAADVPFDVAEAPE